MSTELVDRIEMLLEEICVFRERAARKKGPYLPDQAVVCDLTRRWRAAMREVAARTTEETP